MEALDLLAHSFNLSCNMPHVTLVVVWDKNVCGIDSWWKADDQARILEGLLKQNGIPVGWIGMDENLDPIAMVPLKGELPESLEREILLEAHKAKTGRGIRWIKRNTGFGEDEPVEHSKRPEKAFAQFAWELQEEWDGFIAGMLNRVKRGGRP